ncbi:MAG TPA: hypothetical protein VN648_10335, partial [Candidatus Methylomirabilis sp.]|nr:hypothetical protein [Candidatus Methylomirabilis sp.]
MLTLFQTAELPMMTNFYYAPRRQVWREFLTTLFGMTSLTGRFGRKRQKEKGKRKKGDTPESRHPPASLLGPPFSALTPAPS